MRYTIEGFHQQKLIDFGLDCEDAVFLRTIADFSLSPKMKKRIHDGKEYFWLCYAYIVKELPIIAYGGKEKQEESAKQNLRRRLNSYVEKQIMESFVHKGTKSFYRFTEKFSELMFSPETYDETAEKPHEHNELQECLTKVSGTPGEPYKSVRQCLTKVSGSYPIDQITNDPTTTTDPAPKKPVVVAVAKTSVTQHSTPVTTNYISGQDDEKLSEIADTFRLNVLELQKFLWEHNPANPELSNPSQWIANLQEVEKALTFAKIAMQRKGSPLGFIRHFFFNGQFVKPTTTTPSVPPIQKGVQPPIRPVNARIAELTRQALAQA